MKKIVKIVSIILILISTLNIISFAKNINFKAKESLDTFIQYLNTDNVDIYTYIDTSNTELYDNVNKFLGEASVIYTIKDVEETETESHIEATISASGDNWNVNGFKVEFDFKRINNEFILTNTTLFDVIGTENILKFTMKIFAIIGAIFLIVPLTVVIIVVLVIKTNRKN